MNIADVLAAMAPLEMLVDHGREYVASPTHAAQIKQSVAWLEALELQRRCWDEPSGSGAEQTKLCEQMASILACALHDKTITPRILIDAVRAAIKEEGIV